MDLSSRFIDIRSQSFFLFGPRGTGKSTWLRKQFDSALWVDLLRPEVYRGYTARPERLRELVEGNPENRTVILDEVQKAPGLLDEVHHLMERNKDLRFILTGSSARKLKRSGADLLAGRAVVHTLHPFMAGELGTRFSLEKALVQGLVPLVVDAADPEGTLRSYASLYLRDEVQAEGLVRNIGAFSRFLEAISFSHGSVLNLSHVSRECQVEQKTAVGYMEILEDLLLAHRVPVFGKRAKRAIVSHPKFYYFDTGVFRSLRPMGPYDQPELVSGPALEGLVFQHLRAWIAYGGEKFTLAYWRTASGNEVDFVLYGNDGVWAIEVKNALQLRSGDFSGLTAFGEDYPEANLLLLYRGKEKIRRKNVLCLPCAGFLENLIPGKPFPDT